MNPLAGTGVPAGTHVPAPELPGGSPLTDPLVLLPPMAFGGWWAALALLLLLAAVLLGAVPLLARLRPAQDAMRTPVPPVPVPRRHPLARIDRLEHDWRTARIPPREAAQHLSALVRAEAAAHLGAPADRLTLAELNASPRTRPVAGIIGDLYRLEFSGEAWSTAHPDGTADLQRAFEASRRAVARWT